MAPLYIAYIAQPLKRKWAPLPITTRKGTFELFEYVFTKTSNRNPIVDIDGLTVLHYAAINGHLDIVQLIVTNVENKNPANDFGTTPLHRAASYGHLDICQLIVENVKNKNPAHKGNGSTPLHRAAWNGHFDICKLIIENVENKHPVDNSGRTPKDLVPQGRYDILKLFEL